MPRVPGTPHAGAKVIPDVLDFFPCCKQEVCLPLPLAARPLQLPITKLPPEQAMDTLVSLVEDPDASIRNEAIRGLPKLCKDPGRLPRILDLLLQLINIFETSPDRKGVWRVTTHGHLTGTCPVPCM